MHSVAQAQDQRDRADFTLMQTADLLAAIDQLEAERAGAGDLYGNSAAVMVPMLSRKIDLARHELERRRRLAARGERVQPLERYEVWRLLAAALRERLPILEYCAIELISLRQTGKDEWHGPCPICCQGTDRFWVRPSLGLWACRRCGGHGDVINLYRSMHQGTTFFEACERLALWAGLPLPAEAAA